MAKLLSTPLARPGDPLVRADGRVIPPDRIAGGVEDAEYKTHLKDFRPHKKRTVKDLPAPVPTMNGIACVFMYTALGLGEREICEVLRIDVEQLKKLKNHPAYAEAFEIVSSEFVNVTSDMISARIAGYSHAALSEIANVALGGEDEKNRLRGSMYLMNAAGHGDKSRQGAVAVAKNDLRIVFIGKEQDVRISLEQENLHASERSE